MVPLPALSPGTGLPSIQWAISATIPALPRGKMRPDFNEAPGAWEAARLDRGGGLGKDRAMANATLATDRIAATDHRVPHVSTVPAIAGQETAIFVREKRRADAPAGPPVLMVHGGISHGTLAFDLPHATYSWMDDLARAGFTAYALDMTGYGRSARPMMDDP